MKLYWFLVGLLIGCWLSQATFLVCTIIQKPSVASQEPPTSVSEDRSTLCTLKVARLANTVDPRHYTSGPMLEAYKECLNEKE